MFRRLGRALREASLAALSGVWGAVGGVIGLLFTAITSAAISLPLGVIGGLYIACAIAYQARLRELRTALDLLDRAEATRPRIVFDRVEHCPLALVPKAPIALHAWQLWFKNEPEFRSERSTARKLSAKIEWCDENWRPVREYIVGQWAITQWPHHRGWEPDGKRPNIDLEPVYEHAKLILATKPYPVLDGVFAYAAENEHVSVTCEHPAYRLPASAARVRVTLVGQNVQEQQFQFRVTDLGSGKLLTIEPQPR